MTIDQICCLGDISLFLKLCGTITYYSCCRVCGKNNDLILWRLCIAINLLVAKHKLFACMNKEQLSQASVTQQGTECRAPSWEGLQL